MVLAVFAIFTAASLASAQGVDVIRGLLSGPDAERAVRVWDATTGARSPEVKK